VSVSRIRGPAGGADRTRRPESPAGDGGGRRSITPGGYLSSCGARQLSSTGSGCPCRSVCAAGLPNSPPAGARPVSQAEVRHVRCLPGADAVDVGWRAYKVPVRGVAPSALCCWAPRCARTTSVAGVLEDVEPEVSIGGCHVLAAVGVEGLDAPEVVAALVDEAADLHPLVVLDLRPPRYAGCPLSRGPFAFRPTSICNTLGGYGAT